MTGNDSHDIPSNPEYEFFRSSVRQIRDLTSLPEKHFTLFYGTPLQRFLLLSRFSDTVSTKNHFDSVINALKLRRSITLPIHSSAESIHAQKDVWTYAIFIGALMYGSTKLLARKVVYRYSLSTTPYFRWTPFDGSLGDDVNARVLGHLGISDYASLVFLPLVFDAGCLAWIFRDTAAFNTAIELAVSPDPNTEPGRIILTSRSREPDSNKSQTRFDDEQQPFGNGQQSFENEQLDLDADVLSQNFRHWLFEAMEKRRYGKYLCLTSDGLAISDPGIFQYYASFIKHQDWQHLRSDILSRVPHKKCLYQVHFNGTVKSTALLLPDTDTV